MNRVHTLEQAFQRKKLLSLANPVYKSWIETFIIDETKGDVGTIGDITSNAVIHADNHVKARVISREDGVLAGVEETIFLYQQNNIQVKPLKKDGARIKKGDTLLELTGTEKDLLRIERSALDLLQRMSGIATLTANLIQTVDKKIAIAPTRKTQWRYLDKKAVAVGGGLTHRLGLWDAILIKDNHLKALKRSGETDPIKTSLERAWNHKESAVFVEIEVTTVEEAMHAAKIFKALMEKNTHTCIIMLDNMQAADVAQTIQELKKSNLHDHVLIEASGGITPQNIGQYATSGADVVSLGYLTHSSHALNIKQEIL